MSTQPTAWAIAGSDPTGGAGIQGDSQTFLALGVTPCHIITAVTAQNRFGVQHVDVMSEQMIKAQWQSLEEAHPPSAIKVGMLATNTTIELIADRIKEFKGKVVCDPVLKATSGGQLTEDTLDYRSLLPLIDVFTPNKAEFTQLFTEDIKRLGFEQAATLVSDRYELALLITGGDDHETPSATDWLFYQGKRFIFSSPWRQSHHTHGTGCALSSAIAACFAQDLSVLDAITVAKAYLSQGLSRPNLSKEKPANFIHTGWPEAMSLLPTIGTISAKAFPDTHPLGIYLLVDSLDSLKQAIEAGADTLQLRVKNLSINELNALLPKAIALATSAGIRLFINDHWQLAIKHKAYGVHLGQEDLETANLHAIQEAGLRLGLSTHNWFEIARALTHKPSYIAFGPVFPTTSKAVQHHTLDLNTLRKWVKLLHNRIPITAIGGIELEALPLLKTIGFDSVALISAFQQADDKPAFIEACKAALT